MWCFDETWNSKHPHLSQADAIGIIISLSLERVLIHCLATQDLWADIEQPFDCLIVQNRQAMQSMGRSMGWTLEDNVVDGLFFCATLTGRRGGHSPFCASRSGKVRHQCGGVKPDPRCSWKGHPRRVDADVGDESAESCGVVQPLRIPSVIHPVRALLLLSDDVMSCCEAGTNGCLDLRRRAFPLGGQVSAESSRCSGHRGWYTPLT